MSDAIGRAVVRAFGRAAPPLASYYAITLGVPLANGAAHAGASFARHALVVLVVPPILIVLVSVVRAMSGAALTGPRTSIKRAARRRSNFPESSDARSSFPRS